MEAVDVRSLMFFTFPLTPNNTSPRLASFFTFQPASVLCLPKVNALPGLTSGGAFRSSSAC
jgi:hypothetical protein